MEQKKETRAQLERRVRNSLVFVPRDKDYSGIYFSDRGLRLETTDEYCVISTGFHRHVYSNITSAGVSRPWLYTKRVIEITNRHEHEIKTESGYSFQELLEVLKSNDDKTEYNIVTYYDWFLFNIFQPLYGIAEDEVSSFLVYEDYIHNIAKNSVLLSEHKEDLTNKQFIDKVIANIKDFTDNLEESVLLHKMTDEELAQANIEALKQNEQEQAMEAQINGAE